MGERSGPDYQAMTFEQLVSALEALTERMASGEIGIEEAAELYEEAEVLHALAAERLTRVQARIESRRTAGGGLTAPDPAATGTDPPSPPGR
jgi:exodeoxyribonuclease VII small subunit